MQNKLHWKWPTTLQHSNIYIISLDMTWYKVRWLVKIDWDTWHSLATLAILGGCLEGIVSKSPIVDSSCDDWCFSHSTTHALSYQSLGTFSLPAPGPTSTQKASSLSTPPDSTWPSLEQSHNTLPVSSMNLHGSVATTHQLERPIYRPATPTKTPPKHRATNPPVGHGICSWHIGRLPITENNNWSLKEAGSSGKGG